MAQANNKRVAILRSGEIFADLQREKNAQIIALLVGAIALLDPEEDDCALTLLEMASDVAGDVSDLQTFEASLATTADPQNGGLFLNKTAVER